MQRVAPRTFVLTISLLYLFAIISLHAQPVRTLDYYLTTAASKTPLLVDYANQIQANRIDSARLHAGFGPQVNATGNAFYAPTYRGFGYDPIVTNIGNGSALVGVTQQWVGKQNSRNQYERIRLQNELLNDSIGLSLQALKRYVTSLYVTAYGDWLQVEYVDTTLNLLNNEQSILRSMTQSGTYRQTDYLNFNITLQQQNLQRAQALRQYRVDLGTLNYTCGINDTSLVILQPPSLSADTSFAYTQSLLYRHYVTDSLRWLAEDQQIDFTYRPKLNLFADAGYNTTFQLEPQKNFGVSGGLNLVVPIYNGGLKKLEHERIKLNESTRKAYRDFFVTQYNLQRAQLQQQLASTNALIQQTQQQLTYTQTLVKANYKLLASGDVSITDYLLSMNNFINARSLAAQNTVNRLQLLNEINYWNQTRR